MSERREDHRAAPPAAGGRVCAPVDAAVRSSATWSPRRGSMRSGSGRSSWAGRRGRCRWSMRTPAGRELDEGRIGFKELVAEVGLGHVGLVLALEVSRLARSSADWHQLLDLCALTGTLIADADGIYSPADFNDRLLLGLKGTMSEAELHLIRARLDGGLRNKAERGELRLALPVGLDRDEDDRIVLCADEQVRHAIERVFVLWRRVGSARQVVMELLDEGQQLPRRDGRAAAHPVGSRQLWRGARLPDQPGICRRVRVRPPPPREDRRPRRPSPRPRRRGAVGGVVCLPARAPSRLCHLD